MTFTPTAAGSRTGSVTITDNAPDSPQTVTLSGTAILGPLLTVSPTSLTFPAQYVGTTGLPQNVTLNNTGDQNVTISNVQASSNFAETTGCTSSLAPGAICTLGVFFDPTATGNITGTLTITDNAPGSPHKVALSGTGQDFALAPASGSTTSAAVTAGQTASYNLSIMPGGGLTGNVAFTCSGAPAASTCTVSSGSTTLNGSSSVTVVVNVTTTAPSMTSTRGPLAPPPLGRFRGLPLLLGLLALVTTLVALPLSRPGADLRRLPGLKPFPMLGLAAMLLMALVWAGCGGSNVVHNPGTPAGTYSLTVTGTVTSGSNALKHSLTLNLTVSG